jgi:hypothetical protein
MGSLVKFTFLAKKKESLVLVLAKVPVRCNEEPNRY